MSKILNIKPRMSEKAYSVSQDLNTYVFDVPTTANKVTVAEAVEAQFGVEVKDVRISVIKGKVKKSYQKRNRPVDGKRAKSKKAYVRLMPGSTIAIFDSGEASKDDTKDLPEEKKPKSKKADSDTKSVKKETK